LTAVAGLTIDAWIQKLPQLAEVMAARETFWLNPAFSPLKGRAISPNLSAGDILEAEERLTRFAPYLAKAFPETAESGGLVESKLLPIPKAKAALSKLYGQDLPGKLLTKLDGYLPISGSIKARGGVYEVLHTAEAIALKNGFLAPGDDYSVLADEKYRRLFSEYRIAVGSTGNLGLSIGITGTKLGFRVVVHMSSEAKRWKKDLLRAKGATVIEHSGDYGQAVAAGRREAQSDPKTHFIDDENSPTLFLGYAVAALRLKRQLLDMGLEITPNRPLIAYLPCGVGGAPGGLTFGLRTTFGDSARTFFAEPTQAPSMLLGLMTQKHNLVSAADFGLIDKTEADGLACARPSGFVGQTLIRDIAGAFTVTDDNLFRLLSLLADREGLFLEPSALAGFPGPWHLLSPQGPGPAYLESSGLLPNLSNAVHIVWATGGGMVPKDTMEAFYQKGLNLCPQG
jgi:D-serine dehydratase